MKTSSAGRALIIEREGRRLAAYRDSKGVLTIGVGHTGRMSPPPVTAGMTIDEAQCDAILARDLVPVEAVINAAVKVPLSQNEFDALASLGFNIGTAGLKRSAVLSKLNSGDVAGAADAFLVWSKPAVLMGRRRAERAQFLAPDRSEDASAVAPARAATLATRAQSTHRQARAAQSAGAVALVASATIASAGQAHHPFVALGLAGLALVAAIGAALFVFQRQNAARVLALNAEREAARDPVGSSGVDIAQALER